MGEYREIEGYCIGVSEPVDGQESLVTVTFPAVYDPQFQNVQCTPEELNMEIVATDLSTPIAVGVVVVAEAVLNGTTAEEVDIRNLRIVGKLPDLDEQYPAD
jgi:hypothetical protein